nr:MAG TPA: intron associated endonuclease [Caudoviricetes sp.]
MTYSELLKSELGKKQNVIYKFENLINGKVYIGQTRKQLRERIALHLCESKGNRLTYFHKSINKYGLSNFDNNFFIFSPIIIIAYFYSFENHIFII